MRSSLLQRLKDKISKEGPLSVAQYMDLCLQDPAEGYYKRRESIGPSGDFITAPEITPLFGEMIGAWILLSWDEKGRPSPFSLVELGPGRGTLMHDLLRTARVLPDFLDGCHCHLVESSPFLRNIQKETLKDFSSIPVQWHETGETLPSEHPVFFIANEFFDALPLHQFVFTSQGWKERKIGWAEEAGLRWQEDPSFESSLRVLIQEKTAFLLPSLGDCLEISPISLQWAHLLKKQLSNQGGSGLIIDYGYGRLPTQVYGDTFQAMSHHAFVSVLTSPGEVDLTAHVDFRSLKDIFAQDSSFSVDGPVSLQYFLKKMGIEQRMDFLRKKNPLASSLEEGLRYLLNSDQMGSLFQVLGIRR